jgi:hypothetical protein
MTNITVTREKAIQIFDQATDKEGSDWINMMTAFDLYDEKTNTWATIYDVFIAIGVTRSELEKAVAKL